MIDVAAPTTSVADSVAFAHAEIGRTLTNRPDVWVRRLPGMAAHVSGMPYAGCNGLSVFGAEADPQVLRELIGEVAAFGLPFTVKIRSVLDGLADVLAAAGLEWHEDLPLMTVDPATFRPAPRPDELCLRVLGPDEERFHMDLVAEGLETPRGALDLVMSRANQVLPCWTTYVGEVDGRLAVTGSAIAGAGHAGLIAIATDRGFRRRGYAAALTGAAVTDAFVAGAERVFLHSSPMGLRVYEALGFRVLENLRVWAKG